MSLRSSLASLTLVLLAAPVAAQISIDPITYDGQITEPEWYLIDTDDGGPGNGFGDFNTLNAIYADIVDDGSSVSLAMAGLVDRNAADDSRNFLVVLLDTKAGGYTTGNFGRASGPGGGRGITNLNSGVAFDAGFAADYALQISCGTTDCYFDLYTLSGTAGSGGGPNTFLGTEADPDLGSFLDFGNTNTRTRGYEVRLTASPDGIGTDIQLDRQSIQAFAFIINATSGFLSNQFLSPAGSGDGNYGNGAVNFGAASPDPVVYAEQVFADDNPADFRDKGYRQLAAPARDLTVQWLANQDVVGYNGTPNGGPPRFVLSDYDPEAGGAAAPYVRASALTTALLPGNGFLWYLSDGRRGSQALPWTFEGGGPMAIGTTTRTHNLNADDFYLVGNPFVAALQLSAVSSSAGTIADAVYVFDPGSNSYTALSRSGGDVITHMQGAFFEIAEGVGATDVTWQIPQSARATGGTFVSKDAAPRATLILERETDDGWERAETLALVAGTGLDTGKPRTAPDGTDLLTRLTATTSRRADLGQVSVDGAERVALNLRAPAGTYRWRVEGDLPLILRDAATGAETDLATPHVFTGDADGRFSLHLGTEAGTPEVARRVGTLAPNPTRGTAHLLVDAAEAVRVEVRDVLGRLVVVAFEGELVGPQAIAVETGSLAPGAYVVRVVGRTFAETRRLTVAR